MTQKKHTLKSCLALVLALCMVVSVMPVSAFAAWNGKTTINYVSIGDSMSNGYGFVGYEQTDKTTDEYNFINGEGVYGDGAYPLQFAEWLKDTYEVDVNHTKLGPSGLLTYDLLYLLGAIDEQVEDDWYGYMGYVGDEIENGEPSDALKKHFKDAITDADIITLGLGNAAFGAYLMQAVTGIIGVMGAPGVPNADLTLENGLALLESEEAKQAVLEAYKYMLEALNEYVDLSGIKDIDVEAVLDVEAYTMASFLVTYAMAIDEIVKLNPDVEIILVGLMNSTYGMNIIGEDFEFPFGDVMDAVFSVINTYMAGLPAVMQLAGEYEEAAFYYAEQPNPEYICQAFAELVEAEWANIDDGRLSGTIVRERTIESYNENLAKVIGEGIVGKALVEITLEDILAYENLDWDGLAETYKDYGWNPWGAFVFAGYCDQSVAVDLIMSVAIYLAIEEAVANSVETLEIPLTGLQKIAGNLADAFAGMTDYPTDGPESTRAWLLNVLSTGDFPGMCKIYGLFQIGDGMSVHPTPSAHDEIAEAVIEAYETQYTAGDHLDDLAKALLALIAEKGPEAMEMLFNYADENGYFDGLYEFRNKVEGKLAQWERWVIEAGDDPEAQMAVVRRIIDDVERLMDKYDVKATADQIAAWIAEAAAKLAPYVEELAAMLAELIAVYGPKALDTLYQYAVENGYIDEQFADRVRVRLEAWKQLLTEAAEGSYDTMYAACKQVADEIMAYLAEFDYTVQQVMAWIEEVKNMVWPTPEEIVDALVQLIENFGMEALRALYEYAVSLDYFVEMEQFAAEVEALLNHWEDQFALAGGKHGDIIRVCHGIACDIQNLLTKYDYAAQVEEVAAWIEAAANFVWPTSEEIVEALVKLVEEYGAQALAMVFEFIEDQGYLSGAKEFAAQLNGDVARWIEILEEAAEASYDELYTACETVVAQLLERAERYGVLDLMDQFAAWMDEAMAYLAPYADELAALLADLIDRYGADAVKAVFAFAYELGAFDDAIELYNEIVARLEQWEIELNEAYNKGVEYVEDLCEEICAEIRALAAKYDREIKFVEALIEAIENFEMPTKDELTSMLMAYGQKLLDLFVEYVEENYGAEIEALKAKVEELKAEYERLMAMHDSMTPAERIEAVKALAEELYAYAVAEGYLNEEEIKAFIAWSQEHVEVKIAQLEATLQEYLNYAYEAGLIEDATVEAAMAKLEELKALAEQAPELAEQQLMALYEGATTLVYEKDGSDLYLALGGATASGAAGVGRNDAIYTELLGEAFRTEEQFAGYTVTEEESLAPAGILEYLKKNEAAIAEADLITYQLDAAEFILAALDENAPDWTRYFDEETLSWANTHVNVILAHMDESDVETIETVYPLVEKVVYAVMAYTVDTVRAIEYINAVNPETEIILAGMYNPVRGLELTLNGEVIDVEEIVEYAIEASDLYYLVCALVYDNVTFVAVPEAATEGFNTNIVMGETLDLAQIAGVLMNMDAMYANAEGHEYIYEEIYNAITFVSCILGDVNCDGEVDFADAALLYAYAQELLAEGAVSEQGLMNADVSGDGEVDFADAAILYAYVQMIVAEFPAATK